MFAFNWPVIITTSAILYALIIVTLPFSPITATLMLFSLIAFWSRLPGCCIYEPIRFLYMADFVDILSIIVSIYVGPLQGAFFAFFWNTYPRLAGAYLPWLAYFKDGGTQAIICLFVPLIYAVTGNLMTVIVVYTVIRIILYTLISFILPTRSIMEHIIHSSIAGVTGLIINIFYTKLFGDFFSNLLKAGAVFSWTLFVVATGIILAFSMIVFGFSPKKAGKKMVKNVTEIVKHQIKKNTHTNTADLKKDADDMKFIRDSVR